MKTIIQLTFPTVEIKSKIIIEAGHIYTNEQPSLEHQISAFWGSFLSKYFKEWGVETENWLFVDDYNPKFESKPFLLDESGYKWQLKKWGFHPDEVIHEMELVGQAKDALELLVKNDYAGEYGGKIVLRKDTILLYDSKTDKFMCSLLDACLYLQKLKEADGCITVLDQQYKAQQKGAITILKKLKANTSVIFPFFYSTSKAVQHPSVDPAQVFTTPRSIPEHGPLFFVQSSLDMLVLLSKLSGSLSLNYKPVIEVSKYGI